MGKLETARLLVLWVSGLLAGAIFGKFFGGQLPYGGEGGEDAGALGGMLIFICVRLWLAEGKRTHIDKTSF